MSDQKMERLVTVINDAIDGASPADGGQPRLFDTPVHKHIASLVYTVTSMLYANFFWGKNGQATMVLLGHRGCGKTSTLKALEVALPLLPEFQGSDKLLVRYVATDPASAQGGQLVVPRVAAMLGCDFDGVKTVDALATALENSKSRLVLFVDELDGLYEADTTPRDAFNELSQLGDGLNGRIAVVLCGSHAFIPFLIQNVSATAATRKFQALGRTTRDLNRTKYPIQHVPLDVLAHTDPLAAEAATSHILAASNVGVIYTPEVVRGMLFYAGCRVRYLQQLATLIEGPSTAPQPDVFGDDDTGLDAAVAVRVLALDATVLDMLRARNQAIVRRYGDGSTVFQQQEPWPAVVGLDVQDQATACALWADADLKAYNLLLEHALAFCPSLLLSYDARRRVKCVYPCSMLRLMPEYGAVVPVGVRLAGRAALGLT